MPHKAIIDTDIGDDIDDAYAIAFALRSPEIELVGATTVFGNVRERARLTLKLLDVFGKKGIPVSVGSPDPLKGEGSRGKRSEDVPCQCKALKPDEVPPSQADPGAVDFIISQTLAHPGEITLVPIGALTNVARAISRGPGLKENLKGIVMMAGALKTERKVEWNIKCDPEAAQVVFSSGIPITMAGLDVTLQCRLNEKEMSLLEGSDKLEIKFLMELTRYWRERDRATYPVLHDPLAVSLLVDPSFVRTRQGIVEVDLEGPLRGRTAFKEDGSGMVRVATGVDRDRFVSLFLERLTA